MHYPSNQTLLCTSETMEPSYVRKHGFQRPISPLQLCLIVVICLDSVVFGLFHVPMLEEMPWQILVTTIFGLTVVLMISAGVHVAITDPSHPDVPWKNGKLTDEAGSFDGVGSSEVVCWTCRVRQEWRTEHCNTCNRCVSKFDHHCIWLNNCVGQRNYHTFWVAMVSATMMLAIFILTGLTQLVKLCSMSEADAKDFLNEAFEFPVVKDSVIIVMSIVQIVNLPLLLLVGTLLIFHMCIVRKQLTTLEYILAHISYDRAVEAESDAPILQDGSRFSPLPRCVDWVVYRPRRSKKLKVGKVAPQPAEAAKDQIEDGVKTSVPSQAAEKTDSESVTRAQASPGGQAAAGGDCDILA
eukprot:s2934_g10.t1